jgi:hypothetical protein
MTVQQVSPLNAECACVADHRPSPLVLHSHHIVPLSWGGPDVAANRVTICPNCHTSTHMLLDQHVALGREPLRREMQAKFGCVPNWLVRALAARAWAQRPEHPTRTS